MLQIYTDGGCRHNPGLGAWAIVITEDDQIIHTMYETKIVTTNNEMELTAIRQALYYVRMFDITDVIIYSDSQYAVNSINVWYNNWAANGTLRTKKNVQLLTDILSIQGSAQIQWVKGHSTNRFNNLADQLVNQAMDKITLPPQAPQ